MILFSVKSMHCANTGANFTITLIQLIMIIVIIIIRMMIMIIIVIMMIIIIIIIMIIIIIIILIMIIVIIIIMYTLCLCFLQATLRVNKFNFAMTLIRKCKDRGKLQGTNTDGQNLFHIMANHCSPTSHTDMQMKVGNYPTPVPYHLAYVLKLKSSN